MGPTDPSVYIRERIRAKRPRHAWRPGLPVEKFRRALDAAIGGTTDRRPVALDPVVESSEVADGFRRERITFATREGMRACGWLLVPERGDGAAVVALPGHGIGADAVAGKALEPYHAEFGVQCVRQGWTTLVLEQVSFGRRRDAKAMQAGTGNSSCVRDSMAALMLGETITGWRVRDARRAIDLLAARPDIDPARIGTIGISGGGLTSLFTAALDPRVAACGVSGYFNTWAGSVLSVDHCVDNFVPGLLDVCEMPDLAALIAPRPFFVESGDHDPIFPLATFRTALAAATRIYEASGTPANLGHEVFAGDHFFHGKRMLPFLARALARAGGNGAAGTT